MTIEEITTFAKSQGLYGFTAIERRSDWQGYEVYEPVYDEANGQSLVIGLPYVILVKGETIRLSTPDESLERLDSLLDT